jgi:hypothetical protein
MRNGDWRRAHKTDRYATRARGKAEQATRSARPRVSRGVGGDAAGRVYACGVRKPGWSEHKDLPIDSGGRKRYALRRIAAPRAQKPRDRVYAPHKAEVPGVISAGARLRSRGAGRRSQAPCTERSEGTATRAPSSAHTSHRATMPAPAPSSWWTEPATLRARSAPKRLRQRARSSLCTPQVVPFEGTHAHIANPDCQRPASHHGTARPPPEFPAFVERDVVAELLDLLAGPVPSPCLHRREPPGHTAQATLASAVPVGLSGTADEPGVSRSAD